MIRMPIKERPDWREKAKDFGFKFHTMYGKAYWDETAYYQFSLEQIEQGIEDPTAEIHQMCLAVVDKVVNDAELLEKFRIPENFWDAINASWVKGDPSLYSRLDFAYDGKTDAKLYENNADTPTSIYESGFWQWLWLEEGVQTGKINRGADQFNSLQEKLINQFSQIYAKTNHPYLYFGCCKDTEEDRGTVQYLEDCANEAGIPTKFIYIEDIGHGEGDLFTDLDNQAIELMFKLYPWEFMQREEYASLINKNATQWIEPIWKSVLSNKALLPMLWKMFPNHPNLLPAFYEDELDNTIDFDIVKKPIFSREGANVSIIKNGQPILDTQGPYGEEGFIYQAYHPLPKFGDNYTLIGSWLVNDQPAGISVREDASIVTQDLSRYLPHIILN